MPIPGTQPDAHPWNFQASAFNIIHGEIVAVTSAMRRNSRWAGSSISPFVPLANHSDRTNGSSAVIGIRNLKPGTEEQSAMSKNNSSNSTNNHNTNHNNSLAGSNYSHVRGGLMAGFAGLIMELRACQDLSQLDALTLLSPFLAVVRSDEANGPITALALSSIDKFLTYSFIHPQSSSLTLAMSQISAAGTHCRFEASDSISDEIVLLKILDVLKHALTGPVGYTLTDEAVCQMMETGLSMCCQMRLSEMLRRSAERTMQVMVSAIFGRLKDLDSSVDDFVPDDSADEENGLKERLRMLAPDPRSGSIPAASSLANKERDRSQSLSQKAPSSVQEELSKTDEQPIDDEKQGLLQLPHEATPELPVNGEAVEDEDLDQDLTDDLEPHGLPSIKELMRVLVSLLDPYDLQHTDTMRLTALNILISVFEVAGQDVGRFRSLRAMVSDDLCKNLFQLVRSDNISILSASLRCMTNLLDTMRPYLKIHLELLLSYLMDRLRPHPTLTIHKLTNGHTGTTAEFEEQLDKITWKHQNGIDGILQPTAAGPSAPSPSRSHSMGGRQAMVATGEARQLMLEYLAHFSRVPDFMANLWANFDCNVDCEDVFERLIRFLARGIYPLNPAYSQSQEGSQVLCLDTLLAFVGHMVNRLESSTQPSVDVPAPVLLARDKEGKRALLEGAAKFNQKPKEGLKFLEAKGIIYDDPTLPRPQSLAFFFKTCPRLDKKLLGEYISRPENLEVLKAFMTLFDFRGKLISDCLRELLETFRLPGESQQIARITEVFAAVYVAAGAHDVKTEDAAYVLSYSVIMLNTDQHNPQNRKKMALEDYKRNLRGVNDGEDFSPEYLKAIFDSIRKREIVMPEEHSGQLGFEYAWKELQRRSKKAGTFITCNTNIFDKAMFEVSWKPIISSLSYAFTHFNDDFMLQRIVAGFQQCATLASRFNLPDAFDETIAALARISDLIHQPSPEVNFPTVPADGQTLTISPLSIRFGKNFKAQLAAVVLFTVASTDGNAIRRGWLYIFEIMQSLFAHSILPNELLLLPDFANVGTIPIRPPKSPAHPPERRADTGLLSTLSSYLLSPYVGPSDGIGREITNDDVESTLCAIDCLASCHFAEVYSGIFTMDIDLRYNVLRTLAELADGQVAKASRARGSNAEHHSPPSSPQSARSQAYYDPSALFLLELIVSVATHQPAALSKLWAPAFECISKILANSVMLSQLLVERAIAGLLRLQSIAVEQELLRDQFFLALDVFRSLPQIILNSVAQPMIHGVCQIACANPRVFRTSTQWNMLFSIFTATAGIEEAAKESFQVLGKLAVGELPPGIVAENFAPFISALNSFASGCGQDGSSRFPNQNASTKTDGQVVQRALEAVGMIQNAQEMIPGMLAKVQSDPSRPWASFWMPVLLAYGQQCINGNREVRQQALANLQRSLMAPEILSNGKVDLTIIFERVLFPVLEDLLKPQVFRRDPDGMGETRLRASGLLCKIFLHYLVQLSQQGMPRMTELWLQILGLLDRFMHSGRRDQMYEAVPENLKNVLLVMHASRFLIPPHETPSAEETHLWNATFERIDPVLNTLKTDLFPPPTAATTTAVETTEAATSAPDISPGKSSSPPPSSSDPSNAQVTDPAPVPETSDSHSPDPLLPPS
ncbi:hypothetical protein PCANC_00944 [Puccinia coronata f. sp. avenae]|uniref:SEC7 domain-containing protein n=1 Tax=Puccinia coronata f. sp. avenae TaxID=200324 RepID=A0A2N5TFQ6_9BASI|nr:hypothetical protein PCASD_06541 [Puccinia coronata f. sp. avenae]PLW57917.1 hypothetical protein PCANC_00944 [Puccinia coronata f. sp. avenae]